MRGRLKNRCAFVAHIGLRCPKAARKEAVSKKSNCQLELVRRLSLRHRGYAPIIQYVQQPPVTGRHRATRMRGFFLFGTLKGACNRLSDLPKGSKPFLRLPYCLQKKEIRLRRSVAAYIKYQALIKHDNTDAAHIAGVGVAAFGLEIYC